jgi:hypothetical protein
MRKLIIIALLFLLAEVNGQTVNLGLPVQKQHKKNLFFQLYEPKFFGGLAAIFVAGAADGTMQTLDHDYTHFKSVFPNANDSYCNPGLSWTRKYKDRNQSEGPAYIGSTGPLVCFTDLWHEVQLVRDVMIVGDLTINLIPDKKNRGISRKWYIIASKAIVNMIVFDGARQISFWIYKGEIR